tara:strand:- start:1538 stop:1906 length:369 start_codon:yes stop_codon:yes gene_type:complete
VNKKTYTDQDALQDLDFKPKVMTFELLRYANEKASDSGYNRIIDLDSFVETVGLHGIDPKTAHFPVKPLLLHEHAKGISAEPHMRVMIIGPIGISVILDCPLEIYAKLPYIDLVTGDHIKIN